MENLKLLITGRGTYYDRNINIMSWKDSSRVIIGRYCSIARDCTFVLDANHRPDWVTTSTLVRGLVTPEIEQDLHSRGHNNGKGNIFVGNDVWIATQAMILSGVKIGNGAVIMTRAVVTKDVEPYSMVAGNPAKEVRKRFSNEVIAELLRIKWWDWSAARVEKMSQFLWNSDISKFINEANRIESEVKKIEIVEVSADSVHYCNVTSNPITAEVNIKTEDGNIVYSDRLIFDPDVTYWTSIPMTNELLSTKNLFSITDCVTGELLNSVTMIASS